MTEMKKSKQLREKELKKVAGGRGAPSRPQAPRGETPSRSPIFTNPAARRK